MKPFLLTPIATDLLDKFFVQVENAIGSCQVSSREVLSSIVFDQAVRFYRDNSKSMDATGLTVTSLAELYMTSAN